MKFNQIMIAILLGALFLLLLPGPMMIKFKNLDRSFFDDRFLTMFYQQAVNVTSETGETTIGKNMFLHGQYALLIGATGAFVLFCMGMCGRDVKYRTSQLWQHLRKRYCGMEYQTEILPPNIFDVSLLINHKNLALVQKSAEFECSGICHENVISYENVTLDRLHDSFAYIASE